MLKTIITSLYKHPTVVGSSPTTSFTQKKPVNTTFAGFFVYTLYTTRPLGCIGGSFIQKNGGEPMSRNFDGIKTRKYGIEIEMTGITGCTAAKAIQKVPGGRIDHAGGTYD